MNANQVRAYVATHRPASLALVSYVDGVKSETLAADTVGDTLRLVEAEDTLATMLGKSATFDFDTAAFSARLGKKFA